MFSKVSEGQRRWGNMGPQGGGGASAPKATRPSANLQATPKPAAAPAPAPAPTPAPVAPKTEGPVDMEVDGDTPAKRVATGWASGGGKPKRKARWSLRKPHLHGGRTWLAEACAEQGRSQLAVSLLVSMRA
eukprot:s244_g37.t1